MTLLTAKDVERFLSAYTQALDSRLEQHRSKTTTDLLELDSWRLWTLRDAIRSRNPSFMTKPELEKLMDCKLYFLQPCRLLADHEEAFDLV